MSGTQGPLTATPTMAAHVRARAQHTPDAVAVRSKRRGVWHEVTWARYWHDIESTARMLLALGLMPGEHVVILSENRYEWLLADAATVAAGGVTVAIDAAVAPPVVRDVVTRSSPTVVIVENQESLDTILPVVDDLQGTAHIVYLDDRGIDDRYTRPRLHHWEAVIAGTPQEASSDTVIERMDAVRPTTVVALLPDLDAAPPAGDVALSAGDVAARVARLREVDITPAPSERDLVLPFTSLADRDERLFAGWLNAAAGVQVHFAEALSTVRRDLHAVQPTIVFAPAHVWQRLVADVDRRLAGASRLKRWMWGAWRPVALRVGAARAAGDGLPPLLRVQAVAGDVVVFRALRARIGMRHVRSAAWTRSLPTETQHLLRGIGVPLFRVADDRSETGSPWHD